jgi:hypothetical protein
MPTPLLEKAKGQELVLKHLLTWVITNKIHKPDGNIVPVIGNSFAIQQTQHPFQIG